MTDRFGPAAAQYAAYRPRYPAALFDALATHAPRRAVAWDCATGNGQAAVALAERFQQVVASDLSAGQLAHAAAHPRVAYVRARAEAAPLAPRSVDLVTVAQALHWFDCAAFWTEARRVLVPGGVVAVWCYTLVRVTPAVDTVVGRFYHETVGPWWPPQRALTDDGYRSLALPFAEIALPPFTIETRLTLDAFLGYLGTWSAVAAYRAARGADPVAALGRELAGVWGDAAQPVRWALGVRAGRA